ncbi:MAG: imidazole glycerol phosphate synthase subunit HisH, partial [Candidatus Caenarcaniphilales bacterium]|nr:imidazole glycerol phosphate synthase subunit HisH [Candidatus Caenarcaniphilales bacterium]
QVKNSLDKAGLTQPILDFIKTGKAFLGICVGMQILFDLGYEGETPTKGLGIMQGEVVMLPKEVKRIPHIGWNSLIPSSQASFGEESLLDGLSNSKEVYFVHSYYCSAKDKQDVLAYVEPVEGLQVPAMVKKNNVYGVQFHPERSGDVGLKILSNFLKLSIKAEVS